MEPFKALTFLAAAGVVSLVGAGAAGFYAGFSLGRGDQGPVAATPNGAVSLKPVLEDIRALSKQVEMLAAVRTRPEADSNSKALLDELRALQRQVEAIRGQQSAPASERPVATTSAPADALQDIRDQLRALSVKFDKAEPKASKPLIDEIRALSASVQAQEPNARRAISEEVRAAVAILQNSEPKVPKALMDELHAIAANLRTQDGRPQASVVDQIKILTATIEALRAKLPDDGSRGEVGADAAQLRQLIATASDQFARCRTELAALASSGLVQTPQPGAAAPNAVSVSQSARPEPQTVVFYDNVMLKKDQEKQYDEIGVRLALQSIQAKQVRLAVNRQGFGLAFGERKVFRSQDVECELNLMETNLNDGQARVSISCKR